MLIKMLLSPMIQNRPSKEMWIRRMVEARFLKPTIWLSGPPGQTV